MTLTSTPDFVKRTHFKIKRVELSMPKISYQSLVNTCQALDTFGEARALPVPNKDVILVVRVVGGQKTLQAVKKSELTDNWKTTRSGNDWNATLMAVEKYMHEHEPSLPSFACMKNKSIFWRDYDQDTIDTIKNMGKARWKALQLQKARGYEAFKNCLSEHNRKHPHYQIFTAISEHEKKSLLEHKEWSREITYSSPNLMGGTIYEKNLRLRFQIPLIEPDEFLYFSPFHRTVRYTLEPKTLGFCYEYGLGAKKNVEQAIVHYTEAANQGEFSACYNLGRLYLETNLLEAIKYLEKGKMILEEKIKAAEKSINENTKEATKEHEQKRLEQFIIDFEKDISRLESKEELESYEINEWKSKTKDVEKLKAIVLTEADIDKAQKNHNACCQEFIKNWKKPLQIILSLLMEATKKAEK